MLYRQETGAGRQTRWLSYNVAGKMGSSREMAEMFGTIESSGKLSEARWSIDGGSEALNRDYRRT